MSVSGLVEASAVIRPTGSWSVCLGPEGVFRRWTRHVSDNASLERRLGMLASCTAALMLTGLEQASISPKSVHVNVQHRRGLVWAKDVRTLIKVSVECEADSEAAQACVDKYVRGNPLFSTLSDRMEPIELNVQTHSSVQMRLP